MWNAEDEAMSPPLVNWMVPTKTQSLLAYVPEDTKPRQL
jgi:hypothetical protein